MALHDFVCPRCRWVAVDVNVPISEGALAARVICPDCQITMAWIPQVGRMDASSGPGFEAFETYNSRNEKITISSLKQLRDVERQSEIDYRNGEGQPLVFRMFSNDRSNKDQSALHKHWDGGEQPTADAKHTYGSTLQKTVDEPQQEFGPAVNDSNASALPMEPT